MITEWWTSLDLFMKILWAITLSASFIFIIQSIMTFIGADTGGLDGADMGGIDGAGMDIGTDLDNLSSLDTDTGSNLYTFRNFVNFCLGFGWTAILLREKVVSTSVLIIIAAFAGIALVAAVMYLFKWLSGMQQSGNINVYRSAVGCHGKVYLTIPGQRSGEGKVQISINDSIREYSAITDGDEIKNGTPVKVVEVLDSRTLVVEELESLIV